MDNDLDLDPGMRQATFITLECPEDGCKWADDNEGELMFISVESAIKHAGDYGFEKIDGRWMCPRHVCARKGHTEPAGIPAEWRDGPRPTWCGRCDGELAGPAVK